MDSTNLTYAQAITELEEIVKAIEDGNISVDDLTKKVARGAELLTFCNDKLTKVDQDVKSVLKSIKENSNDN